MWFYLTYLIITPYRRYERWLRKSWWRVLAVFSCWIAFIIVWIEAVAGLEDDARNWAHFGGTVIGLILFPVIISTLLIARDMMKEWDDAVKRLPK
ncbi:MAG: hypothetical protein CMM61_04920 [Rhodospirillaceae bacterium]|nr:hypothetical protein [Rhodospirillaceae bacterium]|tara:strand:- start:645 stop:929 length:285 start_codon:yes stop_codon:yes gene_type:complete